MAGCLFLRNHHAAIPTIKADCHDSCHHPLHQNGNQDCHGNHKKKRYIAAAAVPGKLLSICDTKYGKKVSSLLCIYSPPPEKPKGIIFTKNTKGLPQNTIRSPPRKPWQSSPDRASFSHFSWTGKVPSSSSVPRPQRAEL